MHASQVAALAFCKKYGLSEAVLQPLLHHMYENLERAKQETVEVRNAEQTCALLHGLHCKYYKTRDM